MVFPLSGAHVRHGNLRPAGIRAVGLLERLGADVSADVSPLAIELSLPGGATAEVADPQGAACPDADWAESGAMWLTGRPDGPPLAAPGAPATAARGAALAVELVTSALAAGGAGAAPVRVDGATLLGERAAIAGLSRNGATSAGGSCRLVVTASTTLAVNLARPEDVELVPAWLEVPPSGADPWGTVIAEAVRHPASALADRAALMGIPAAVVPDRPDPAAEPWRLTGPRPRPGPARAGRVVDLSSMWAGPLCANLLGLAGFEVVKVESTSRPDGARNGPPEFYDLLHGGHRSITLDFGDAEDLSALQALLRSADIVIESSRPRALEQLGLAPGRILPESSEVIWVSITGYGRTGIDRNRVAFGDDAAAAAGLVARCDDGAPVFCGDAIADPLAGMHAALAALAMWAGGCGGLADVAMRDVVASTLPGPTPGAPSPAATRDPDGGWVVQTTGGTVAVARPAARTPTAGTGRPPPEPGRKGAEGAYRLGGKGP